MIDVDAHVWYWTAAGMRQGVGRGTGYIDVREVEELLQQAHARGAKLAMERLATGVARAMDEG